MNEIHINSGESVYNLVIIIKKKHNFKNIADVQQLFI